MTNYSSEILEYLAKGGVIKYGKTKWAKGAKDTPQVLARSKKNMNYESQKDKPMGLRVMNFDSVYNIPQVYNGAKMVVGKF